MILALQKTIDEKVFLKEFKSASRQEEEKRQIEIAQYRIIHGTISGSRSPSMVIHCRKIRTREVTAAADRALVPSFLGD